MGDFSAGVVSPPADGAIVSGVVHLEIQGSGIENAELLPPTDYTPKYGTFTISPDKTSATLDFDTKTLADGSLEVRVSAFNAPAGENASREITAMSPRTWQIKNTGATATPTSPGATTSGNPGTGSDMSPTSPGATMTPAPAPSPTPAPTASTIESQIKGAFRGWTSDRTVVELTNGQIWKQAEYAYEYAYLYMPKVIIYYEGGQYIMQVEGMSQAVAVVRLQ